MAITAGPAASGVSGNGAGGSSRGRPELADPHYSKAQPAARNARQVRRPLRVLVVDDDPATRLLCSINLQVAGLVVREAADGRRALEQARAERPDLVLTDVRMPGLDGFELAEALGQDERTREIPLIFLSGECEPVHAQQAHKLGALAYLSKPLDPERLTSLLAGVVADTLARERLALPAAADLPGVGALATRDP